MMENIKKALNKYWGYTDFLPLQKNAMECIARRQDSIVVLPTGGGKSLCFQAPAVTCQKACKSLQGCLRFLGRC
jgi:ATP-dependent DNA helicase RecQ